MKYQISIISRFTFLVLIFSTVNYLNVRADNLNTLQQSNVFSMETLDDTKLHEGLAGTFFGKQNNWFILAGGSSFPEGKPWENGIKHFSDKVFVFSQQSDGSLRIVYKGDDLPTPIAEGAYVTLPNGLFYMGGITPDGITNETRLIIFNGSNISVVDYPSLPFPVKSASATVIGNKVYLVGGEKADGTAANQFLSLDITNLSTGWEMLPDFPVPVTGTALIAQQDGEEMTVFAFGGRAKNKSEMTTFYSSVYSFRPTSNRWYKRQEIRTDDSEIIPIAMATAAHIGATHILLYGGDDGSVFNRIEFANNDNQFEIRDSLQINHKGFNNKVLIYNTITDSWFQADETINTPIAVASSFSDGANIYIAGGEVIPGVRSPLITHLYFTTQSSFGLLNYVVLIIYFVGMLCIGFYFMKRNENTEDFFKASGRIPWWAAGISIFATSLSAITFLSIPAKTYASDWRMLIFNICIILIVPIVIKYFLPFFTRFKLGTAYEYLELRFNRTVRWLASALFVIFMVSRIAIVLFLPSLALNAVTGFDIYLSIIVMGVVTIIYSTSGGMEAVVWGDVIQGFILVFGAIAALVFMVAGVEGGLSEFWNTSIELNKFKTFDFRLDFSQPVFWVVLIGGVSNSLITYTSDQSIIQRYMSTKDEKTTSRSIWLNGILSVPVTILFFLIGTGLLVFYKNNPSNMMVNSPNIDSVFAQFIVNEIPVGFAGLLIAAIFAAAMSTLSSNINSSAAVITSDFYQTIFPKSLYVSQLKVARWSGLMCGLLGLGMALVLATWNIASLWDQFNTFLGLLTCGLGALFILGVFFPKVGSSAALVGVVTGLLILLFIKGNTSLSFLLYGFIGMSVSILIAWIMSFIIPNKKKIIGYTWKSMKVL